MLHTIVTSTLVLIQQQHQISNCITWSWRLDGLGAQQQPQRATSWPVWLLKGSAALQHLGASWHTHMCIWYHPRLDDQSAPCAAAAGAYALYQITTFQKVLGFDLLLMSNAAQKKPA